MEHKFSKDEKREAGSRLLVSQDWDMAIEVLNEMIALADSRRDSAQAKGETNQGQYYAGVARGLVMAKDLPKVLVTKNTSTMDKVKQILEWAINTKREALNGKSS